MNKIAGFFLLSLVFVLSTSPLVLANPLLQPGDFIIAIDADDPIEQIRESAFPENEPPSAALDEFDGTKYLNFGTLNTGFIATPQIGSTTVQSMQFVTANDAVGRDPASWALWGTNDFITSEEHSDGSAENWTLIASDDVVLPEERQTAGPLFTFPNSTAYSSYRLIFPTIKDYPAANSMQIADVFLWESNDGTGGSVFGEFDDVIAVQLEPAILELPDSRSPAAEGPGNAIDGDVETKYLNFGRMNSGFIVTPSAGPAAVDSFQITTANDFPHRDPAAWELYGTNDPIVSEMHSQGDGEDWTFIDSGSLSLPLDRFTAGDVVTIANATAFASYKMIFPEMRQEEPGEGDPANASDSIQYAEIQFFASDVAGLPGDFNDDGVVDGADFLHWQRNPGVGSLATWEQNFGSGGGALISSVAVPEPAGWVLLSWATCGLLHLRRRSR